MANPRKFSEKIALHNQKQAEETAAFEKIMREVMGATRSSHGLDNAQGYGAQYDSAYISQAANGAYPKHQLSMPSLGSYRGGSLPNVNQMSGGQGHSIDLQGALHHLEDMRHGREMALPPGGPDRPHGTRERGRHATAPHKSRQAAFDKRVDVSPYSSSLYLSPPPDSSWRRTNSDSALHQSAQSSGGQQDAFAGVGSSSGQRRDPVTARDLDQIYRDCPARLDGFGQDTLTLQDVNSFAMDIMHLKGYWDPKGGGGGDCFGNSMQDMGCDISQQHRPKSCEVPGINIYMPQDDGDGGPMPSPGSSAPLPGSLHMPAGPNMGNGNTGSLPDLTSLHFPPPLATPLDPSEELGGQQQHPGGGMAPMHSRQVGNGSPGGPGSPHGPGSSPSGRRGSPGPAPSPSSRRRAHHSSTSVVLGGGRHHGSPGQGQTPTSPRPRQLYQGGAPSERSGSAPGSPVSHGASSSPTSPPGPVGSPYGGGNGYGRAGSAMGSTSPLQQQMEQFRVATGGAEDHSPSAGQNQYFVLPDGRYCNSQGVPTSSSSSGGVFFPDVGGGGMADPLSCPMGYSHGSLYFTGDMQYTGKGQATDNPQTPQTPTSIPDIILTGGQNEI
ncbi:hypothetical protein HPB47_016041 [Ixodes persulcatus]|uniref:Uncharacterized protein n=1 Tax=Ixodes persulcatus TaxID=34615 RepID=A0AC60QVK1_IXOPE|nr:hypothetical protein HPB47_016041 [Ixodes persulcatus]